MKNAIARFSESLLYPNSKIRRSEIKISGKRFRFLTHSDDRFIGAAARGEKRLHDQDLSELEFIIEQAKDASIVFDVGANIGLYASVLAQAYPKKQIVSIEPDPTNFALLVLNLKENGCSNVLPINVALTNCNGWLKFFRNSKNPGDSMSFPPDKKYIIERNTTVTEETVQAVNSGEFIQSILNHFGNPASRFYKIDTQGMEIRILESLTPVLVRNDRLSIELSPHHLAMCGTTHEQTVATLGQYRKFQRILASKNGVVKTEKSVDDIKDYITNYPDRYDGYWDILLER